MKNSPIPRHGRPAGARPFRAGWVASLAGLVVTMTALPARSQTVPTVNVDASVFSLHLQQDPNMVREMVVRLRVMGDEYAEWARAAGLAPKVKPNIYVFSKQEDYAKNGGLPGSGFNLMLNENRIVMHIPNGAAPPWSQIQGNTFRVLYGNTAESRLMAPWVYAGMATYYELARWTGDGLVTGNINADLARQVQMDQKEGKAPGLDKILPLDLIHWYQDAGAPERMRKSWAMIQFLAHGDGGKYRPSLAGYLQACAKGDSPVTSFGDAKTFETRYQQWLSSVQAEPNAVLQTQATVATLASFLARGHFLKMKFPTAEDFFQAARAGKVAVDGAKFPWLWLPANLLSENLKGAEKLGVWSLDDKKALPTLVLTEADGTIWTGSFTIPEGRHPIVKVERKEPPKAGAASKPAATASH